MTSTFVPEMGLFFPKSDQQHHYAIYFMMMIMMAIQADSNLRETISSLCGGFTFWLIGEMGTDLSSFSVNNPRFGSIAPDMVQFVACHLLD